MPSHGDRPMKRHTSPVRPLVVLAFLVGAGLACAVPAGSPPDGDGALPTIVAPTVRPASTQTPAPQLPTESPGVTPLVSSAFRDDFDGALDPGWSWYQGEAPGWTLSNMPGWLRLNLSTGSFLGDTPPSNMLVRQAPSGDFELKVWLRFSPVRNFELAGVVVVFDDASVLQFGRGFCEVPSGPAGCIGDGLYFDNIQAGSTVGGNFATQSLLGVDYLLRLERQGNSYSAAYSTDGSTWFPLGSHTIDKVPVSIGLIAAQAETAGNFADFDYFEMTQH